MIYRLKALLPLLSTIYFLLCLPACQQAFRNNNYDTIQWAAAWSPDGGRIATGGNNRGLLILGAPELVKQNHFAFTQTITSTAFHPTDPLLAVAIQLSGSRSHLINLETGEQTPLDSLSPFGARAVGWNPDGTLLALGDNEGNLVIYDRQSHFISKVKIDPKALTGLSWHPTKPLLAMTGSRISLYNIESEELITVQPRQHEVLMLCVDWHPSGNFFVTGDYGDKENDLPPLLQFRDEQGNKIREVQKGKGEFRSVKWSPDGNTLATTSDKIRLWTSEGEILKEKGLGAPLWGLSWNPAGDKLVTSSGKGQVVILDKTLQVEKTYDAVPEE
ncbi:WD40 repeat domain-containing protein [Roseivirga sp. BDSF3-8]|uniref:WD40 repeat domain-containing protein n=1 Tax=Roseivirga sp. BDSF3-8 TaxID=3241598 RepID=UPI0035322388